MQSEDHQMQQGERVALTMKDIARMMGVSVATVSRALSGSPSISKKRREEIQQFAREHNFFPNAIAEQLRHSRKLPSRLIGVIIPEFIHYYFSSILSGIEQAATQAGYRILVAQSNEQYEREVSICESFYQNKVCGIIVSQAKDTVKYDHFKSLIDNGVPLVFYDRICVGINVSRVVVDDYVGAYNAVDYMIKSGCKRIAYYGTSLNMQIGKNRFNGYKDAIYHNGLEFDDELVFECDNSETAERITPEVLKRKNRPDGFFAVNDDTAIATMYVAKRMGLKVPDEVAVCGFTNGFRAQVCDPKLTTVEQRGVQVGREAVDVLLGMVEGRYDINHVEKRMVKTRLVVRETTKKLPEES